MTCSAVVSELLIQQSKMLLKNSITCVLPLAKWKHFFQIMPLNKVEVQLVFMRMLEQCRISKFREVNFKILVRILLMLKILSKMKKDLTLSSCPWCNNEGMLEHVMFACSEVRKNRKIIVEDNRDLLGPWSDCVWCFGSLTKQNHELVWVINFAMYKAVLHFLEGYRETLMSVIQSEYT